MTAGETVALTKGSFASKLMSPFFNTLPMFGALGKCRAVSEQAFYVKLPGGLERQWE